MAKPNEVRGDEVTQKMSNFRFYSRRHFEGQTGYSVPFLFRASLLAYALGYGNLNYSKNHSPVHYNDTATAPWYRYRDSHLWLEPKEMVLAMTHDLPEDIGKIIAGNKGGPYSLLASYVVMDAISAVLSQETGMEMASLLDLITNKGETIFGHAAKRFELKIIPGSTLDIDPSDLVKRMESDRRSIPRGWGKFYSQHSNRIYLNVIRRLERVLSVLYSPEHSTDLDHDEREYVGNTIRDFAMAIEERRADNGKPKARELKSLVDLEYEKVIRRVSAGNFQEVDRKLLLPSSSETIARIKKTLYGDYIGEIMDVSNSPQYAGTDCDPAVVKCADSRDIASRLGPTLDHTINQFRKIRIVLERGSESVDYRRNIGLGYEKLNLSLRFLLLTLEEALISRRDAKELEMGENTQYQIEFEKFDYMLGLMPGFKSRIKMNPVRSVDIVTAALKEVKSKREGMPN